MILIIGLFLIIITVLLNFIFILKSKNNRYYKTIIEVDHKYRKESMKLLNKHWKKQIIIIAIGITLGFVSMFIDVNNKVVLYTFLVLSIIYIFIAIILGIYNYYSFNKGINNLLNKTTK